MPNKPTSVNHHKHDPIPSDSAVGGDDKIPTGGMDEINTAPEVESSPPIGGDDMPKTTASGSDNKQKSLLLILITIFIAVTIPLVVYLAQRSTEIRERAQVYTPTPTPTATPSPPAPACGIDCNFPGGGDAYCQQIGYICDQASGTCQDPQCPGAAECVCPQPATSVTPKPFATVIPEEKAFCGFLDVMIVIDRTNSMYSCWASDGNRCLEHEKYAAKVFVDQAAAVDTSQGGDIRIGVASFGRRGDTVQGSTPSRLHIGLTNDYEAVKASIDGVGYEGHHTCAQCGIRIANREINDHGLYDDKVVILFADGETESIWSGENVGYEAGGQAAVDEANNGRNLLGIVYWSIQNGDGGVPGNQDLYRQILIDIAGGQSRYRYRPDPLTWANDVLDIFNEICEEKPVLEGEAMCPAGTPSVDLSWTAVGGVTDYRVQRCIGANCTDFAFLARVDHPATTYTDNTVVDGQTYRYRVRAHNDADNSVGEWSNEITVTVECPVATPTPSPSPTAQCTDIRVYEVANVSDPNAWRELTQAEMSALQPGDVIYVTTRGSVSNGVIDRARIRMNSTVWTPADETRNLKPGTTNEYYRTFTIPSDGTTTFTFEGEVCLLNVDNSCTWF